MEPPAFWVVVVVVGTSVVPSTVVEELDVDDVVDPVPSVVVLDPPTVVVLEPPTVVVLDPPVVVVLDPPVVVVVTGGLVAA